jgi:hypothetical protein
MIENLVAGAVASLMLERIEELLRMPEGPNFYWPLTTLPRPLFDTRLAAENERGTLRRSYPLLNRLEKEKLAPEQARRLGDDLFAFLLEHVSDGEGRGTDWRLRSVVAVLAARSYHDAKQSMIARGLPAADVEAMPVVQVVLAQYLDEYDQLWDDSLKWMAVPYAEAREPLEGLRRQVAPGGRYDTNLFVRLAFPTVLRVHEANLRINRHVEALRCVEAVRHYAATHDGKPPAVLADIKDVPLPIDPSTGKGFDAYYKADGSRAVLDVPPLPGQPPQSGRRYEFTPAQ